MATLQVNRKGTVTQIAAHSTKVCRRASVNKLDLEADGVEQKKTT